MKDIFQYWFLSGDIEQQRSMDETEKAWYDFLDAGCGQGFSRNRRFRGIGLCRLRLHGMCMDKEGTGQNRGERSVMPLTGKPLHRGVTVEREELLWRKRDRHLQEGRQHPLLHK